MVNVTFVSESFTVTDMDNGTEVRSLVDSQSIVYPNGSVRAEDLYANMDVLMGVFTDYASYQAEPEVDMTAFRAAFDGHLRTLFSE